MSPYNPLQLGLGLTVWAVWFSAIYGVLSVVCAVAPPPVEHGPFTWINGVLLLSTVAVIAVLLFWARRCYRAAQAATDASAEPQATHGHTETGHMYSDSGSERWSAQDVRNRRFIAFIATGVHVIAAVSTLGVGLVVTYIPPCI